MHETIRNEKVNRTVKLRKMKEDKTDCGYVGKGCISDNRRESSG